MHQLLDNGVIRDLTPEELLDRENLIKQAEADEELKRLDAKDEYLAEVRELREKLLNRIDGIAFRAQIAGDTATVQSYLAATQRLLDITKLPAVLAATNKEEAEVAVKAEYASIVVSVKSLAPTLVSAFYEVAK